MKLVALILPLAACGAVVDKKQPPAGGPDAGSNHPPIQRCDPSKPFGTPAEVANINTTDDEIGFALADDEKLAIVDRMVQTPSLEVNLLMARRPSSTAPFGLPSSGAAIAVDATYGDEWPGSPTSDGLFLYFGRQVPGDPMMVFAATRLDADADFSDTNVTVLGQYLTGYGPVISNDGLTLYWMDQTDPRLHAAVRDGGPEAFTGTRVVSAMPVGNPTLSADELTMYYTDGAQTDILVTKRASTSEVFRVGVPVANINAPDNDAPMYITADDCVLYMSSNRPGGTGGMDIWQAQRPL